MTLRTSTIDAEGVYQGSKYLKYQLLCSIFELKNLFQELAPCYLFPLTHIGDGSPIILEHFFEAYESWIEKIKQGIVPDEKEMKPFLAAALTADPNALWKQQIPDGRFLIKIAEPVIQLQSHYFSYSRVDGVFRPMTMSLQSIFWGLQFSFPGVYQDPKTMELLEVEESVNLTLFQKIKRWVRDFTRATPFIVDGKRVNVPIRLGKECFSWIHTHPQLIQQKIGVYAS